MLDVIRARRDAGSRPGHRTDGHCVGLAVEGGGMRGVVSSGMLAALLDLNCRSAFDLVIGASAGAIGAAYFLTDTGWAAVSLYFKELVSSRFIRPLRAFSPRPVMSLDYLVDLVVEHLRPLDWQALAQSLIPLHIVAASLDSLSPVILAGLTSKAELSQALRATACLPLIAGKPIDWEGDRLVDAAVLDGHPAMLGHLLGCSHVLALSTSPVRKRSGNPTLLDRYISIRLSRVRKGLGAAYLQRLGTYAADRATLAASAREPATGPILFEIAPSPVSPLPRRLDRRVGVLMEGALAGYSAAASAIDGHQSTAVLRLSTDPSAREVQRDG
ncbi:MAG: patatin-like phospholipase family protein [Actinomycetota bacterium]|nr:patatin-like phospholipase family protein [Actinomycetota bacterium]